MNRRWDDLHVLFGPPFATFEPSSAASKALVRALRSRGALVTTLWCDQAQRRECAVYGGVWGGGTEFNANCTKCSVSAERESALGNFAVRLSEAVPYERWEERCESIASLTTDELAQLEVDDYPIGRAARQILSNMWTTEDWQDIPGAALLLRTHVENLLRLNAAYSDLLDSGNINRVVSNDSSYGMWGLLHHQAARRLIPAYSMWPMSGSRVATGDVRPAMQPDFSEPWPTFRLRPMKAGERDAVDQFIGAACRSGSGRVSPTRAVAGAAVRISPRDPRERVIVLAANAVWDLASFEKQHVFEHFQELVRETITWFASFREGATLVVRSHPVERDPALPPTRMSVSTIVERLLSDLGIHDPDWLVLDDGSVPLANWIESGATFVVNTSTTGAVAAALERPVITTGMAPYRGLAFTHEPSTPEEYFDMLTAAVAGELAALDSETAKKYLLLQNFIYYSDWDAYRRLSWLRTAPVRTWGRKRESKGLEYVADRIALGERIMSAEVLPPTTLPA